MLSRRARRETRGVTFGRRARRPRADRRHSGAADARSPLTSSRPRRRASRCTCRTAALPYSTHRAAAAVSTSIFASAVRDSSIALRAFIERHRKSGFGVSLSRKALDVQQGRFADWRLLTVKNADCSRRSPFRSRAWHARRPPVDLRERSHHGACLFATPSDRSRPRPVARIGRRPELPTDDASRLVRGFSHRLTRNPRRAPWPGGRRSTTATHG